MQIDPHPRLLDLVLQPDLKLLGLTLQPDSLKLGSCKFNIIISIKNIIIYIKNIIIFIITNIANIIINKFEKQILLILKNNHRFDLNGKIKNYKNLSQTCLILLLIL